MAGMSVETTNMISKVTIGTAVEAGAVAWGAAAISSPIGALGGALFGAVRYVSQIPLIMCGTKCLNANNPQASTAAKTLAKAIEFFGSYAIAWGILAAAGFSLTLSHVVTLTLMSIVTSIALHFLLVCLGLNPAELVRE